MAIQKSWDDFPYKVFVSYSQRDKSWGEWLEAKLEAYRIPKKLHGRWTPFGLVPEQIKPVFRDRTGLGAEHSLEKAIEARLDDSATLVVICSPNAAGSPYVDAEVRHFKASGKSDRVFAFIVDGEPGDADRDPFVPALKSRVDARTGELTEEPDEPIAADAREIADGRENAFLKLVAGLLGVDLTDLQEKTNEILEREAARARLVRNIVAALGVLAVVFGALGFQQRNVALRNETRIVARAASDLSTKGQHVEAVALALEAMPTAKGALMPRPPSPYAEAIIRGALMSNALARLLPRASAISPDGRWAFRNGENGWTLVDLATGDPTTLSLGDDPTIADAQFSPDSARLVAPKYDGTVVVFDVAAPARPRFLSDERFKPKDYVFIRDFSAGGSVVWLVTRDQAALWDLESGALLVASEDLSAAYGAKLSDDGRILRLKDDENGARVLALTDIRTGVDVAQFIVSEDDAPDTDDRNGIVWADLSHDGLTAAASTPEGALHVWRLDAIDASDPATAGDDASGGAREDETGESETGEDETETNAQDVPRLTPTFTLRNSGYRGGPLAFSPSGRKIATAGWSEAALRIWSVEPNGDVIQVDGAEVTDAYPLTIAFSEDESLLARMTETGAVQIWNTSTGFIERKLYAWRNSLAGSQFRELAFTGAGDEQRLLVQSSLRSSLLNIANPLERRRFGDGADDEWFDAGAFSPNARVFALTNDEGAVYLFETETGRLVARADVNASPDAYVEALAASDVAGAVAIGDDYGALSLWRVDRDAEPIALASAPDDEIYADLSFSRDGALLLACTGSDGAAQVFSTERAALAYELTVDNLTAALGEDSFWECPFFDEGGAVIVAPGNGVYATFDAETGAHIETVESETPSPRIGYAVTADGTRAVSYNALFDARTGDFIATFMGSNGFAPRTAVSPRDNLVVTAAFRNGARVWDAGRGVVIATLIDAPIYVRTLEFSADGRHLLAVGDGVARLFEIPPQRSGDALVAQGCDMLREVGVDQTQISTRRELWLDESLAPPCDRVGLLRPAFWTSWIQDVAAQTPDIFPSSDD